MGPAVVGPAIVESVGVVMAVGGADGEKNSAKVNEILWSWWKKKGTHAVP